MVLELGVPPRLDRDQDGIVAELRSAVNDWADTTKHGRELRDADGGYITLPRLIENDAFDDDGLVRTMAQRGLVFVGCAVHRRWHDLSTPPFVAGSGNLRANHER